MFYPIKMAYRLNDVHQLIMERWSGKIAVVTGASAGIGAQIAIDLVKAGLTVIGLARRKAKIEALREKLVNATGKLIPYECDVSKKDSIKAAFLWIEAEYGVVNVLINNAGINRNTSILANDNEHHLEDIINTNLMGLVFCTKETYRLLSKNDAEGHIININSLAGHYNNMHPEEFVDKLSLYPASKFAVTATTEMLRRELNIQKNRKVRVSSISPGLVKTEILEAAGLFEVDLFESNPFLSVEDLSAAVLFVLGAPQNVSVHEIIIRATGSM